MHDAHSSVTTPNHNAGYRISYVDANSCSKMLYKCVRFLCFAGRCLCMCSSVCVCVSIHTVICFKSSWMMPPSLVACVCLFRFSIDLERQCCRHPRYIEEASGLASANRNTSRLWWAKLPPCRQTDGVHCFIMEVCAFDPSL